MTTNGIRVPVAKWLPTPLLSDGFGSAFGTSDGLGNAEGLAGGIGAGGSGVTLSNAGGTWSVSGGKAINTPSVGTDVIVNGGFDADTDWTKGAGWSIGSGVASHPGGPGSVLSQSPAVAHKWCKFTFTLSLSFAYVNPRCGGVYGASFSTNGTFTQILRADSSDLVGISCGTGFVGTIDNISVYVFTLSELLTLSNLACADVYAGAAITKSNDYVQAGLALNWDSASSPANGLIVYLNRGMVFVDKCVAGTWTNVSTTAYTYSAGARLVCTMNAGALRVYYDGALITTATIVDAGILTGTYHGLFSTDASNTLDDLTIYATGTGGEYSQLDSY